MLLGDLKFEWRVLIHRTAIQHHHCETLTNAYAAHTTVWFAQAAQRINHNDNDNNDNNNNNSENSSTSSRNIIRIDRLTDKYTREKCEKEKKRKTRTHSWSKSRKKDTLRQTYTISSERVLAQSLRRERIHVIIRCVLLFYIYIYLYRYTALNAVVCFAHRQRAYLLFRLWCRVVPVPLWLCVCVGGSVCVSVCTVVSCCCRRCRRRLRSRIKWKRFLLFARSRA